MKSHFLNNNQHKTFIQSDSSKLNCIHKYDTTVEILITLRDEN